VHAEEVDELLLFREPRILQIHGDFDVVALGVLGLHVVLPNLAEEVVFEDMGEVEARFVEGHRDLHGVLLGLEGRLLELGGQQV